MRTLSSNNMKKNVKTRRSTSLSRRRLLCSLLAFGLTASTVCAQQIQSPLGSTPASAPVPTPVAQPTASLPFGMYGTVLQAASTLDLDSPPKAAPASYSEDFSLPAANNAPLPSSAKPDVTPSPSSPSTPFRTVANTTTYQDVAAPAAPVIQSAEPFVVGPEFIVGEEAPIYDGAIVHEGYYPGPMPMHQHDRFQGPNIGYDPRTMSGCAPEDCRIFYAHAEALYWKQEEDQSLSYSVGRRLSDFDFEYGGRLTIGEIFDCVNGIEFVYTGPFESTRSRDAFGPGLNSTFRTGAPFAIAPIELDTFFNANFHRQNQEAKLSTYEVNRRWFASDLFSTLVGVRMIDYDEDFFFQSVAADGGQGLFLNNTENFLVGAQFGVNMYRPLTQRLSYGGFTKLGVFANFAKNRTYLENRGFVKADAERSDTDIAGMIQGGIGIRYRVLPRFVLTGGYEYFYTAGLATVGDQRTFPLTDTSPNNVRQNDQVLFHGANAGVEFSY